MAMSKRPLKIEPHMKIEEDEIKMEMESDDEEPSSKPKSKPHIGRQIHQCTVCEKNFSRSADLEKHMVIHTGARSAVFVVRTSTLKTTETNT